MLSRSAWVCSNGRVSDHLHWQQWESVCGTLPIVVSTLALIEFATKKNKMHIIIFISLFFLHCHCSHLQRRFPMYLMTQTKGALPDSLTLSPCLLPWVHWNPTLSIVNKEDNDDDKGSWWGKRNGGRGKICYPNQLLLKVRIIFYNYSEQRRVWGFILIRLPSPTCHFLSCHPLPLYHPFPWYHPLEIPVPSPSMPW